MDPSNFSLGALFGCGDSLFVDLLMFELVPHWYLFGSFRGTNEEPEWFFRILVPIWYLFGSSNGTKKEPFGSFLVPFIFTASQPIKQL